MKTIEVRNAGRNQYGNGLIAKGYIKYPVSCSSMPESTIRSWSYGLGRGLSGLHRETNPFASQAGGAQ